jgi:hypothetical protein
MQIARQFFPFLIQTKEPEIFAANPYDQRAPFLLTISCKARALGMGA